MDWQSKPILDKEAGTARLGDDLEFWFELVELLIDDTQQRVTKIGELLTSKSFMEISREAHSIKGAAANVEACRLQEAALLLERDAEKGDLQITKEGISLLETSLKEVEEELHRLSKAS